ncbi:MAG: hypothetical protein SGPRY_012205, partial [Prymnesium sp.]
ASKWFTLAPSTCVSDSDASNSFSGVYSSAKWGLRPQPPSYYYSEPTRRRSASGYGSDLGYATSSSLAFLKEAIKEYNITSLIDVPCGDANWQFGAWETDSLTAYVGLDIAPSVIRFNSLRFAHHANKRFLTWDIASCALPLIQLQLSTSASSPSPSRSPAQLVHVRDVLQHMPRERVERACRHILSSGALVVVATTYPRTSDTKSEPVGTIKEGEWTPYDLEEFHFPKPVRCIPTHALIEADLTCLYHLGGFQSPVDEELSWLQRRLTQPTAHCARKRRVGGSDVWGKRADGSYDGEWWVCFDEFSQRAPRGCVVYGFGVGSDWSFEEVMGAGDVYGLSRSRLVRGSRGVGCEVHAFDPSMGLSKHKHQPGHVAFWPIGLDATNALVPEPSDGFIAWANGRSHSSRTRTMWRVKTLATVMSSLAHGKVSLMKVDVEGYEWGALLAAYNEGALAHVDQLVVEMHLRPSAQPVQALGGKHVFRQVLQALEEVGFQLFHSVVNSFGGNISNEWGAWGYGVAACYEVSFIRQSSLPAYSSKAANRSRLRKMRTWFS